MIKQENPPLSCRILAVIQARSGSKGIPKKNIYPILGHPLMAYSIQAALDSTWVSEVLVSTDSEEFAEIARSYGAEAPFLRPDHLSGDLVTSAASLQYAVIEMEKIKGVTYDYVVELPCVSPLRNGKDVDQALKKLLDTGADAVISVSDTGEKHPMRLKKLIGDRMVNFTEEYPEPGGCCRRQDLKPPSYIRNGAIYAMKRDLIVVAGDRMGQDFRAFIMDPERSVNIDERMDLLQAECMLRAGYGANHPVKRHTARVEKFIQGGRPMVLVTAPMHFLPEMKEKIKSLVDCVFAYGANRATVAEWLPQADAWLCSPCPTYLIDGDLLKMGTKLKMIATPSTGSNHIDRIWCAQNHLAVACLKDTDFVKTIKASSEFTWGLIMAVVRKIPKAVERVKQGYWRNVEDSLRAVELAGKTIGIIGFGRIGANVARYAHAFDMNILAYDPLLTITEDYVQQVDSHARVLTAADILLIAVHLDQTTEGMVDASWFSIMKKGAVFINISRGEIVDEPALLVHLENGHLSSAGLDVISDEFLSDKLSHPLVRYALSHDNVLITPHIAGLTKDSELKAAQFAFANLCTVLNLKEVGV